MIVPKNQQISIRSATYPESFIIADDYATFALLFVVVRIQG